MRSFAGSTPEVARAVAQRFDDRTEVRLRREAAHRIDRSINRFGARIDGRKHAGRRDAAGVVRVEMNRQADFLLQRLHQGIRRAWLAQPSHVLDAEYVRAGRLELARQLQVVVERVFRSRADRSGCRCSRSPPRTACRLRAPRRSKPACSRPS